MIKLNIHYTGRLSWKKEKCDFINLDNYDLEHFRNKIWMRHNNNGPSVIHRNYTTWWVNGNRHRLDGPAVEWTDNIKEWYIHGKQYTEFEYWIEVQNYDIY